MSVTGYLGITCDHLYETCPNLRRSVDSPSFKGVLPVGDVLIGSIDPEGSDVCGWCLRVWKSRKVIA